ncbi:ABC transporter substrate-binding protein [Salinigranum halophilum]|jgi:peptide/nickel transport system substrate-binding protein|uniref:ABC transporter substrate-binding protein n=1 Tax=Salinigranum halophilum TaxID=2565931 RepID=UPI0010A8A0A9|nr:ABC transporter substrate-binding protein [Salinigranum halophilum]
MQDDSPDWNVLNRRRVLGLGAAGLAGLAGCAGGDGDSTGTEAPGGGDSTATETGSDSSSSEMSGGRLRIALVKSPLEFDPIILNDVPSAQVTQNIYDGLYEYDAGTGFVPQLATGSPEVSNGGTRWVVEMTGDATFHNGDPLTAEDVKYTYEAPVNEETENAPEVNMIESITVVDETTVQFDLSYPFGPFQHALTGSTLGIVPQSVRESDRDAFNTQSPVGSGPFEFVDWQEGNYVRLQRNDDYWGEPMPNLAELELVPVEEATTRVTTLRNGENDVIEEIPPKLYSTVRGISDASIDEVPGIGYFYLAFNCNEGPTADPMVREAVDYCFSMDQAVSSYVEPTGVRQYSPLPRSLAEDWDMPLDEWEQIPHEKNIEEAQALFDEAGVPMDYQWRIIVPPDDKREQIGISVSNGLKEAGFDNVSVQRLDWGAFLDKYVTGSESDYNMYTLGWSGTPDPDAFTYYLLGRTDDVLGQTNGTYWGANSDVGQEAAQKFVTARESPDYEERRQLYIEGITTALEERAHLPAYNLKNSFGVKEYVNDFTSHPVDSFHIATNHNNVSVDR